MNDKRKKRYLYKSYGFASGLGRLPKVPRTILEIYKIETDFTHEYIRCKNFALAFTYAIDLYGEKELRSIRRYFHRPKGYKSDEEIPRIRFHQDIEKEQQED